MKRFARHPKWTLALWLLSLFLSAPARSKADQGAWQEKSVQLHIRDQSLQNVLAALQAQLGVPILADDAPLRATVSLDFQGVAHEALEKITDAFDYTWTISKNGTVLVVKRFQNPQERPQAHPSEMRQIAKEIVSALQTISTIPERELAESFTILARMFTAKQQAVLQNGSPLRVANLTPRQQNMVLEAINTHTFAKPQAGWNALLDQLNHLAEAYVYLAETENWLDFQGTKRTKQLSLTFRSGKSKDYRGIVYLAHFPWQPLQRATTISEKKMEEPETTTLQNLLERLPQTATLKLDAATELRSRRLTVYGEGAPAQTILEALTEMYDCQLSSETPNRIQLVRKRRTLPKTPTETVAFIAETLPPDIRRFLRAESSLIKESAPDTAALPGTQVARRSQRLTRKIEVLVQQEAEELAAELKPMTFEQNKPTDRKIHFSFLSKRLQEKLTFLLLLSALNADPALMRAEVTPYVRDPLNAFIEMRGQTMSLRGYDPATGSFRILATSIGSDK